MKTRPTDMEKGWLWFIKQISGVLVFVLIIVHIIVNHLVAQTGLLSYADVVRYFANPWIAIMESSFLIFVIGHSLLGLRSVILDFNPSISFMKMIDPIFLLIGILASGYGIWLTITVGSVVL
jgi:succinate dehydrogenase / fumarate reductase membrane anchor subunit